MTSTISRGRRGFFASSSLSFGAIGAAILSAGVVLGAPGSALAADECGAGSTVTCTTAGNPYANGIFYITAGDQTINFDPGVKVDATGSLNGGLFVITGGVNDDVTVNAGTNVSFIASAGSIGGVAVFGTSGDILLSIDKVATSGANVSGILGGGVDGAVKVTSSEVSTNGTSADGIDFSTNDGDITIISTKVVTLGNASVGINAVSSSSGTGDVSVTAASVTTSGTGSTGINASSVFGATAVKSTTVSTTGAGAAGIVAASALGGVTVKSTTVTTIGAGSTGILVNPNKSGSADVTSGTVSATGVGSTGIEIYGDKNLTLSSGAVTADGAAITVSTVPLFAFPPLTRPGAVSVTTTGDISSKTGNAITTSTQAGSILVNTAAGTKLTSTAGTGISAIVNGLGDGGADNASDGNITIVNNADLGATGARIGGTGINAQVTNAAGKGKVSVTLGAGSDLATVGAGVNATNAGAGTGVAGDSGVTVLTNATSTINTSGAFDGINAQITGVANLNSIDVTANGDITTTGGVLADGIAVSNLGLGATNVSTGAGKTISSSDDSVEVFVTNTANTKLTNITVNGTLAPSAAGTGWGVNSSVNGTGGVTATVSTTGIIAGSAGVGVFAQSQGTAGDVTVVNNGAIGSGADSVNGDGVQANITNVLSTGAIKVSGTGTLNSAGVGVNANNLGKGTTTAGLTGALTSVDDAIRVASVGVYTVNADGATTSTSGNGVQATGANGGSVNIASGAVVRGLGASGATAAIDVTAPVTKTTTINNGGTVRSTNATVIGSAGDLAIKATGGSVVVNNTGRIDGRMDYSGLAAGSAVAFASTTAAASLHATGLTTFSAGNDTFTNTAPAVLATSGATTFDFGADTGVAPRDSLINSGVIVAGETTGASTFTLTGLETFANSGTIAFGSLDGGLTSDGQTNDRIVSTGTGVGTAFTASGSSLFLIDANLGATTQTSCAAAVVADCLSLPGGSISGVTRVRVNNTGAPGGAANSGIVVVDNTGGPAIPVGAFVLDTGSSNYVTRSGQGAVDAGFYFYRLLPLGTNQYALISAPDGEAFEFAEFGSGTSDIWYQTTGTMLERTGDIRETFYGPEGQRGWAVWLKAVGASVNRDVLQSTTSAGTTFTFDTSYHQETAAIIGGIDFTGGSSAGRGWAFGVDAGYVDADMSFDNSPTRFDLTGTVLGVYATWTGGGFYLDGTVNANFLKVNLQQPSIPGLPSPFTDNGQIRTYGAQLETGYRFGWGQSAYFEPMVIFSYARTTFDDFTLPGGSATFDDGTSMRAAIGARIGGQMVRDLYTLKASIYGRVWDEFNEDGQVATINTGGGAFVVSDRFSGVFYDVGGQVDIVSAGPVSGFLGIGYKWKEGYSDGSVNAGLRVRF